MESMTSAQMKALQLKTEKVTLAKFINSWRLYVMLILPVTYFLIFEYYPMLGIQIAFKKFMVTKGIWGSPWVGFHNFEKLFDTYQFWSIVKNTVTLSAYELLVGFPFPIILALLINSMNSRRYKKIVQMATYAPYFISTVVVSGIVMQFLSLRLGIVNHIIEWIGLDRINFMGSAAMFPSIYVWSEIWQNAGWGTIIYLAVLAGVDPQLHESAVIDGASKFKRIIHIDIPSILPTVILLFIFRTGHIMNVDFQKVLLLQTPLNLSSSEVVQTYVYKVGLASAMTDFSFATAIGLFLSILNFILIISVNQVAKRTGETSLW